jgi:murein DD-endopeptidase MepM/ murein hydrolase activator NlpD
MFSDYARISSQFGPRWGEMHKGIDLVKEHQGPIYAFVPGEVIHAKMGVAGSGFGNYGNVVAIKDKYGALHCYCHLDSIVVKVGSIVEKGQMIARQGNTGDVQPKPTPTNPSAGSHLHYEVRKKHSPKFGWEASEDSVYNPAEYLEAYFEKEQPKEEPQIFPDVANDRWSKSAIAIAVEAGIMQGYPDGTFRPAAQLSREEFAVSVVRLINYLKNSNS